MTKTDELLTTLADEPLPIALNGIEPEVMARFRQRLEARAARRSLAVAGLIALTIGGGSGVLSQSNAYAAQPLLAQPLLGVPAEAPSNLLVRW